MPIVVVSRKTVARTSAARSGATRARKVCAGRPFFIRIGVSQASSAPAASTAVITSGHSRGSRSSTLVSRTSRSSAPWSAAAGSPTSSRSTLAWPSGSRPPAPTPTDVVVIAGCGPYDVARVVSSAAPVGVQSSVAGAPSGPAYDGTPVSSAATAGGGTGRVPCAPRTVPEPTAIGVTTTSVGARWTNAGAHPDHVGDRVERADLVEVHVERVVAVHGALGDREPLEDAQREVADRVGRADASRSRVADVAPGPVVRRVGDLDVDAGRGEAVAGHRPRPAA